MISRRTWLEPDSQSYLDVRVHRSGHGTLCFDCLVLRRIGRICRRTPQVGAWIEGIRREPGWQLGRGLVVLHCGIPELRSGNLAACWICAPHPFVKGKSPIVLFLITLIAVAKPEPNTFWSPYSRIDFVPLTPPSGSTKVSAYSVVTNHLWHQWAADLSPNFLLRYPQAIPNSLAAPYADLVYRMVPNPRNVLVLGSGTGNDVAGALRHGAEHIDAVEIDPQILRLGNAVSP